MNWGLIGCGDMAAKSTAPAILRAPGCRLAAVCSRRRERAEAFARRFGVARVHADASALAEDPAIDAVFVSTPVSLHAELSILCLERGKHVLCEKPMAMSTGECLRMERAARERKRLLGVAYYRRGYPQARAIRRMIEEGAIGKPLFFQFHYGMWYRPGPDVPGRWRLDPAQSGGGALPDIGSHRIDLARFFAGPFESVAGSFSCTIPEWRVDEAATALLRHRGGAQSVVQVSFSERTELDRVAVHGTGGAIVAEPLNEGVVTVRCGNETTSSSHGAIPWDRRQAALVENFAAAVRDGAPLLCPAREGAETTWAIESVLRPGDAPARPVEWTE